MANRVLEDMIANGIDAGPLEWVDFEYDMPVTINKSQFEVSASCDFSDFEWFELRTLPRQLSTWRNKRAKVYPDDQEALSMMIHRMLRKRRGVSNLRWYKDYSISINKGYYTTPLVDS